MAYLTASPPPPAQMDTILSLLNLRTATRYDKGEFEGSASGALTSQQGYFSGTAVRGGITLTGVMLIVNVAAAGTNPTRVRFGIYDSGGAALLASTADFKSGAQAVGAITTAGELRVVFSATYTPPSDTVLLGYLLINGTYGTTQPQFLRTGAGPAFGNSLGPMNGITWGADGGTGKTDLPASFTPTVSTSLPGIWFGLY